MNIYQFLQLFFFGFGMYSFIWIILKRFSYFKAKKEFYKIDEAAITTIGIVGLLYLLVWIFQIILIFTDSDMETKTGLINRMFGKYAFGYWLQPLFYIISSQLLWINSISKRSFLRFILGFLLCFNLEKFMITLITIHRDYLPNSWTMYGDYSIFGWIILDWILKLIIFSSFATVIYYLKNRKTL
jgi:hypothetical protein